MKRFLGALLAGAVLLGASPVSASVPEGPAIQLDGYPLVFDVAPRLVSNRTMVPFRAIGEALGLSVHWIQESQTVLLSGPDRHVELQLGNPIATVDGKPVNLDVPAFAENGRTLVPLRFVGEATGAVVHWNPDTNTVSLTSPVREMRGLAFYALRSYPQAHLVSLFSDVAYGWAMLDDEGNVDLVNGEYRWPEPDGDIDGDALLTQAREEGVRRHLMIQKTDGQGTLKPIVINRDLHEEVARQILDVVLHHDFDGVVLDLEELGLNEQGAELANLQGAFTHLVQTVSGALREHGKALILSAHPPNGSYQAYDYPALAPHVDLFQLMAHEYSKENDSDPEPPHRVYEAIEQMVGLVSADKILLGVVTAYENETTLPVLTGLAKRFRLAGISVWRLGVVGEQHVRALNSSVNLRPPATD